MSNIAVGAEAFAKVREVAFGCFRVRPVERKLLVDGHAVRLGSRAFDLLLALIERRDRMASKNELLDAVWPGRVVEENNLQTQISALRKLLGSEVIVTIPGRGYRFAAELDGARADVPIPPTAQVPAPSASARYAPGNLPQGTRRLIGREDELAALITMVKAHSLTTVVGAGGIGKTTLALAAGDALRDHWRDGVWVVEMARIADRQEVPGAVARALGLSLGGATPLQDQLIDVLGTQSLLLILDNCEHLVDAVGELAEALVGRVPGVHVLTTSQELLNVRGEQLFKLKPLAVPEPDADARLASTYGAARLFEERARAVDPRFSIDAENASAVVEVCRQLDGLPLAIELAAARVRLVGVNGLRDKLGAMFHLLTGGARTALPRHQTLRAALEWSYGLLSAEEQIVLRRLGVFVGGFTLELAQQVACDEQLDEWAVLDALGGLVDKSLVVVSTTEAPRYRLLETTRLYALERLAASGETAAWVERHARVIHLLFVKTEESRFGEDGSLTLADYMKRLTPELDNLRAAFEWCVGPGSDPTMAVELAATSSEVYRLHGLTKEALDRMQSLSARVDTMHNSPMAALFLSEICSMGNQGRVPADVTRRSAERAEATYRRLGYRRRLYRTLYAKGWELTMLDRGSEAEAILPELEALESPDWPAFVLSQRLNLQGVIFNYNGARFEQSVELFTVQRRLLEKEAGEEGLLFRCLTNLCLVLLCLHRDDEVVSLAQSVMTGMGGDRTGVASTMPVHLTRALAFLGRLDEANQVLRRSMAILRRDRLLPYYCGALTVLLARAGRVADAIRLQGASSAFIARNGLAKDPVHRRMADELKNAINKVGASASDVAAWRREGELLDEPAIAALCLTEG